MDRIPKEVLGLIFSFLSERFRRYIEITCKEWRNLIRNEPHIISLKIRDITQYFPNSDFPSFSMKQVKEFGIVVVSTENMNDRYFSIVSDLVTVVRKTPPLKHTIKIRIHVNLPNYKRRNEYAKYLKDLYEYKFIKILKHVCFLCYGYGSPETNPYNSGASPVYRGSKCVLCKRYIYVCCYNQILQKTCGFVKDIRNQGYKKYPMLNPSVFYCIDCIDVAIATKKVVICKKCNGYFDITNNKKNYNFDITNNKKNDIYCKDCGLLTECFKKRCGKCRQEVCKLCNPCEPIPFCNNCLYMCTNCEKFSENLVKCKICELTRYCSEECQAMDLENHTKTCESHLTMCYHCGKQKYEQSTSRSEQMKMLERCILNYPNYDIDTNPTTYKCVLESNYNVYTNVRRRYLRNHFSSPIKLPRCSRCKMVSYCNKTCQRIDWKHHKKHCFKL